LQAWLSSFRIEVTTASLDERHQAGVKRAVKSGLIRNTLLGAPKIEIVLNSAVLVSG
jgi:hypothetical protein